MTLSLDNWCLLPTSMGEFRMYDAGDEYIRVVCFGDLCHQGTQPLLRIHSSCLASEVFGAIDCDCADQLRESMKLIATEGQGLIIHLHQEGRGHGLSNKIKAIQIMQSTHLDTAEAFETLNLIQDIRNYDVVVHLLRSLRIESVRLISNNPNKIHFLQKNNIKVELVHTHPKIRPENAAYLQTKKSKLGHCLPLELEESKEQNNDAIYFYHSDQPWGELSNFSPHAVFLRGKIWPTVEHFYQAQKFIGTRYEELIRRCQTPMLAKIRASELSEAWRRQDWQSVKEKIMLEGLKAKFDQHPELSDQLLRSGNRILVEHTGHDAYWGDAGDGTGLNRLGYLLMMIRLEIQEQKMKSETRG